MTLLHKRVNVKTGGIGRNLLLIKENIKGDLYIIIKSGPKLGFGPSAVDVLQHRYSIHSSKRSNKYNSLKLTSSYSNGTTYTTAAITDAVKLQCGFAPIFFHRSSDLANEYYDLTVDSISAVELGDFDPTKFVLIFAVFVGSIKSNFDDCPDALKIRLNSSEFQIIILYKWYMIPAAPFSWTYSWLTIKPEIVASGESRVSALKATKGQTTSECHNLFRGLANELIVNLLEFHKALTPDEENRRLAQDCIDSIRRMSFVRV